MDKKYLLIKYESDMGKIKIHTSERFSTMPRIKPNQRYKEDYDILKINGILYVDGNTSISVIIDLGRYTPDSMAMSIFNHCTSTYDPEEKQILVRLIVEHSRQHKLQDLLV